MRVCAFAALLTILMSPLLSLAEDNRGEPLKKKQGVAWSSLLKQTGFFLAVENGIRIGYEPETRAELVGPFFKDWYESVRGLHGWVDGDPFAINYIGHPFNGAVAGRIFVQNDPSGRTFDFSNQKPYWMSRLKALGWSALYSTTFELAPFGEAGIGNIGGAPWPDGMTFCDLVNTPVLGTGLLVAEDLADRYVILWLEKRTASVPLMGLTRTVLNPSRSMANLMRFKWPWYRDSRPGLYYTSGINKSTTNERKQNSVK
jgi:hypothetical protein